MAACYPLDSDTEQILPSDDESSSHIGEKTDLPSSSQSAKRDVAGELLGGVEPEGTSGGDGEVRVVWGKERRAMVSIAILTAINLLNYMDRYSVAGQHSNLYFYFFADLSIFNLKCNIVLLIVYHIVFFI